jgi:uncharacterized protein
LKVRAFTDEVLNHSNDSILPVAAEFKNFIREYELEEIRETEEYLLELISFGVLWKSYSHIALSVKHAPFITLAHMAEWRKKHQRVKPLIDLARGILFTLLLLPRNSKKYNINFPTLEEIDHVCKWFEATGEFREQALRFIRWRAFWGTKPPEELAKTFFAIRQFTNWFEEQSILNLGEYTKNVENFLQDSSEQYRWREDRISCSRARIEYHLNMVGAELMNRAFRNRFCNTETKVILLPGCMRVKTAEECKAAKVQEGLLCEDCSPQCRVNQLREMGKKQNFDVYIIPHASDLSLWSPKPGKPSRGVIASACVTTLVEGGWELKRYGVEAQCVLLDNCGCKKHWGGKGIMTELNIREMKRILN